MFAILWTFPSEFTYLCQSCSNQLFMGLALSQVAQVQSPSRRDTISSQQRINSLSKEFVIEIQLESQMKLAIFLLPILALSASRLSSSEIRDVKESGLLKVRASSHSEESENQKKCCFSIQMENKRKRKGYDKIRKKFNTIKSFLISKQIITDGISLQFLKQQIRMNHNRKVWHFKRSVCFLVKENEETYLRKLFKKYHVKRVAFGSSTDTGQQDLLMKALSNAKRKASELLEKTGYRIKKIQSIAALTEDLELKFPNMDFTSAEYDPEVSSRSQEIKKSISTQQQADKREQQQVHHVEIQLVFSVEGASQSNQESSSEEEAHSEMHSQRESQRKEDEDSSQEL